MKSKTILTNRKLNKKVILALTALGIVGISTIVATQARRNVLNGALPFTTKEEFKVLEIVPTNANDANEEIGYFVSDAGGSADAAGKADFREVSLAKSLGGRSETDVNAPLYKEQLQNFLKLRDYGLVKYEGIDRGVYKVDISENPIYSQNASFVKRATEGYSLLDDQLVLGKYEKAPNANGSYFLKDGYSISENGLIYKKVNVEVNTTVSVNGVSQNSVSTNTIYEPIIAGNPDDKQLPEAVEQRFDSDGELIMTGDVNFVADDNWVYYGFTNEAYYVYEKPDQSNAFHNGDWFKEYVLGDRASDQKVVVETKSASEVTADLLGNVGAENYDLIYISGTRQAYINSNSDLSEAVVMRLYNMTTLPGYQAVMMDYKLLDIESSTQPRNIDKLALLLWQKDQRAILKTDTDFEVENDLVTSIPDQTSNTWSVLGASMEETPGLSTGNFVAGSVYVYDHKREYFDNSKVKVDAGDFFANGDFASPYTSGVVAGGFVPVKIAVQMNNINHKDKKVPEAVTPAMIIQYILAYDGTNPSLVKTELQILEIQPVRAFRYNSYWGTTAYTDCEPAIQKNRETFIKDFLDDRFASNPSLVSFTSMTIEEFIGRNDDLNEKYDMIYIGSEIKHKLIKSGSTTQYNSELTYYYLHDAKTRVIKYDSNGNVTRENKTAKITDFNDYKNMAGNVYYNIGDVMYVGTNGGQKIDSLLGILEDGSKYQNTSNGIEGKSRARYSGRDLTENKLKAMKEYLDAGYPVIVAADIVSSVPTSYGLSTLAKEINPTRYIANDKGDRYDHGRVDNSSKLYEFLNYAVNGEVVKADDGTIISVSGVKENLISEGDVKAGLVSKADISDYLNKPKLSVNITSRPVEYSYTTSNASVGPNNNKRNEPVIGEQTKLSPDPATGKYYLDYEFTITNAGALAEGGTYNVHLYVDVNADGKFSEQEELKDCTVTNAVTGVEVQPTNSIEGKSYSLQADVLYKLHRQVPEGYSGILPWNLEIVMENNILFRASEQGYTLVPRTGSAKIPIKILQINNNNTTLNLSSQMSNAYSGNNYFGLYLKELKDYEVEVITVSQTDFQKDNHQFGYKKIEENQINMLILGFGDCYDAFTNTKAVDAIIAFIESGKPVLLTHDLVMFRSGAPQTRMLRNYVGMDRYGCYDDSEELKIVVNGQKKSVLNYILKNGSPFDAYERYADAVAFKKIEGAGHRVVYKPNSGKNMIDTATQGISNLTMVRYRKDLGEYSKRYIAGHDGIKNLSVGGWNDQKEYMVHKINEGQITTYPYILPDSFNVAETHNQYYQLDMEGDMDEDGETDIVVWYTLGNMYEKNPEYSGGGSEYTYTPNDVVNGYYIYNKGNVTYSGVGHRATGNQEKFKYEAQLFVNTMIAAYRAGTRPPQMTFYESERADAVPIVSLPVVYDKNVGKNADLGDAESSVLKLEDGTFKNEFIDSGAQSTKLYFELEDDNLVRGKKGIKLDFYVADDSGSEEITVNGEKVKVTKEELAVYNSDFTYAYTNHVETPSGGVDSELDKDCMLQPATRYGIELPLSKLKDKGELKLYVSATTTIYNKTVSNSIVTNKSTESIAEFSVIKMDLLNLD